MFNVIQKRDVSYHTNLHVKQPGFDARSIDSLDSKTLEKLLEDIRQKKTIVPEDTILMEHVGLVDLEGSSVSIKDQIASAVEHLTIDNLRDTQVPPGSIQDTIIMPHGSVPVNEYNNALLWYMSYPWLFPFGRG